jgi:hypothetical protein
MANRMKKGAMYRYGDAFHSNWPSLVRHLPGWPLPRRLFR